MELIDQVKREMRVLQMEKEIERERQMEEHRHFEMCFDMRTKETKHALRNKSFPQILERCRAFPC